MKKQIFQSVCIATAAVFLSSFILIMGVLYNYFSSMQMKELQTETFLAASAVKKAGESYLSDIANADYRITWIASDGSVLFDNKANSSEMENHLERAEIKDALTNGSGKSIRYSTTLTERRLYCAQKLPDGSVLRLSSSHLSMWMLMVNMLRPILLIIGIALILSLFLAHRLTSRIMKPFNELSLDEPNPEKTHKELSPLLNRIISQKNQLELRENELKRKKKEFDTATENMQEGIILLGETGNVLSINRAASKILQISSYCIGKDLLIFDNTAEIRALLQLAASGEHAEKTISIGGKDYQCNASPIVTEGNVSGTALILFDITEKEKAEVARREFTANVSHELKTPLQNISGYAELLSNGMVKPEDVQSFSSNIYSEAKRMIALIEDIIELSHLDEKAQTYEFEKADLYELAKATHHSLLSTAQKKDIAFTLEGESAFIHAIPSLLSEILYNLCDNAIKYTPNGGHVSLLIQPCEDKVLLNVEDNGIGIPQEERERIFERFYRVDKSRSKKAGGTGLGLSIVKHAAMIHQAEINVNSKLGEGSRFSIRFVRAE